MYVNLSDSQNLVTDLGEMLSSGISPKVYFALFENQNDINMLSEALDVLDLKIEGCIIDEDLLNLRHINMRDKIRRFMCKTGYTSYDLSTIKEISDRNKDVVIVAKNDINFFHKIIRLLTKKQINCSLFHTSYIKNSAIVDGKVRVVNRIGYLNEWPWFLDILNKDMPLEKRKEFIKLNTIVSKVVSNGEYYYYDDIKTDFSEIKDGCRLIPLNNKQSSSPKYKVTLLGDSRFVNAFAPTELTIGHYLQKTLNYNKIDCYVRNFSVEANRIQNQFAMLKSMEIGPSDIIFLTVCPLGLYEGFTEKKFETLMQVKTTLMLRMTEYCRDKGAELIFVHLPLLKDIPNKTKLEEFISDSYGLSYSPDRAHERMKQLCMASGVKVIDLTDILINNDRTCFFIDYSHLSPEGSKMVAITLSKYVKAVIDHKRRSEESDNEIEVLADLAMRAFKDYVIEARFKGLSAYIQKLQSIAKGKPENCGVIVMNCNPFTYGHRYLIETASKSCDYLYIMAVEEDRSVFKFADRFEMIRRGVSDLENVEVIPSGNFVISALTFPEYFQKSQLQDEKIDTSTDIKLFCEHIAPTLHIKTRFVGEEPLDKVTNQYNMCMKDMLPNYGITLIEIPRKEYGESVISASRVRKLLEEKNYQEVKKLVPKTTYDYLINTLGF